MGFANSTRSTILSVKFIIRIFLKLNTPECFYYPLDKNFKVRYSVDVTKKKELQKEAKQVREGRGINLKFRKNFMTISCLLILILGYQNVDAQQDIAQEVYAIFEKSCLGCHGESGAHKDSLLIDRTALVDSQVVLPGAPANSEFYKRLLGPTENGPQMPLNLPPLSQDAIETVARWITEGAPDWDVQRDINFITTDTILDTIQTHLKSLDPFDRPSARYFTLTHLYNAGESPQTLSEYRIALSKLINSLSWKFEITNPTPIDTAQTIFHIDLRHYEWRTRTDVWALIEQTYPYNIEFDTETQAGLLEKLTQLQTETGSTVPFINADWFLATASLPPLYHDILDLPQTDRVLEAQLEVNVASNIRNAPGINVWRAGFNDSGVSTNNRVVERHTSRNGAYWKSYDFAGSADSRNIFTHPLDFTHDGGEIIFNLPNGLQAYFLVDADGTRLNEAPIDIVSNPAASDPTVRNGLSCIGCHTQGMKKFTDSVRAAIEADPNPPYNKAQALRLYPEQFVLDDLLQKDTNRFLQALEKIGGPFDDDESRQRFLKRHENEPVQRFHEVFQAPLNASHAAAAVGLETTKFLTQISEKQSLKNLGLQTLIDENGTVKRDAWTSNFHDVISALNTPDSDLPPVVERPERIPGAGVYIPDANLRAAIEEALGKAADEVTTVEDMETLTELKAEKKEINDLTGLQFAKNLEVLKIGGNPISDLSSLATLKALKELDINWTQLSDLSPLAGLVNLQHLEAWSKDNTVSNLSPLANLTNLKHLDMSGSREITDISPLAKLTGLTYLRLYDNAITDITPLAGLINLKYLFVEANHTVLNLAPLANLTRLELLQLANNKISDVSPLSGLTTLENLYLNHNNIKDIVSLVSLRNLTKLWLQGNSISDISPLAGLINLKELKLTNNPITDFSPLTELFENTNIVFNVTIPDVNLRAVIADALGKEDATAPITLEEMATLTTLRASNKDIKDLTGLEYATNLTELSIGWNPITDLSPLTRLTKMREIYFHDTQVSDLSPLASLYDLEVINAAHTRISSLAPLAGLTKLRKLETIHSDISDLSPLEGLTNLTRLYLYDCQATDLSPLKGLTNLRWLGLNHSDHISDFSPMSRLTELRHLDLSDTGISDLTLLADLVNLETLILNANRIVDVSPLASLRNLKNLQLHENNISDFSPLDGIRETIEVFTWFGNPAFPQGGPNIEGPWLWLTLPVKVDKDVDYLAKASDNKSTEQQVATLGASEGTVIGNSAWSVGMLEPYHPNPNNFKDNKTNLRRLLDSQDAIASNTYGQTFVVYGSMTLYSPKIQQTKIFIGASAGQKIYLNGKLVHQDYTNYSHGAHNVGYRTFFPVTLQKGKNVLLVRLDGLKAHYDLWSLFFGFEPGTEYTVLTPGVGFTFSATETTLLTDDTFTLNLNAENITDLAGWQADIAFDPNVLEAVEVTEGDFLKSEVGTTFFQGGTIDNTAGKITDLFSARIAESGVSGTGTLLSVTFKAKAGGETQVTLENFEFSSISGGIIPAVSPNITITVGEYPPWDVNQDGRVSVQDIVLVANDLGAGAPANLRTDVNRDGVVDVQDLILVQEHLGESTDSAASPILAIDNKRLTPAMVQSWIKQAQLEDDGSIAFRQGIENLQKLLASLLPEKTALLPNYPNPFNPETWIPYHLAKSAEVTLTIYAANGAVVRTLTLGHQVAGIYQSRPRAAYWDGRNEVGESVASGVYFYTLTAGDFTATRKMLILK